EAERILRAQLSSFFDECPVVHELRDPGPCRHGKMMAAVRADVERLLELVVSVVRFALWARVRMTFALRLGCALVLDRNVDSARHGATEFRLPPPEPGYKPSAAASRPITARFTESGVPPVKPAPTTAPRAATS